MTENEIVSPKSSVTDSNQFGLDNILIRIGQCGKFQLYIYILICIPIILNAVVSCGYVFVASTVIHRCRIPECDNLNSSFQEPWIDFSIPKTTAGEIENCYRFVPHNKSFNSNKCHKDSFNRNLTERCGNDFIFRDNELTISNDFNIFCSDEWKLSLFGTISNIGQFIGVPLGGYFSDRYGRRNILAIGGFLSGLMGVIRSFSFNFEMFLAFGFLDNVFAGGLYSIAFVLGFELVSPNKRILGCTLISVVFSLGLVLLALVAKYFPSWRLIHLIFYIPAIGQLLFLWILPESVMWLLSQGEEFKAIEVLQKAAKVNGKRLSEASIEKLLESQRNNSKNENVKQIPFRKALKLHFFRILNCSFCCFANVLVYYGLISNLDFLGGNKYDNFILMAIMELPGLIIPFWTMDRIGRRYSLFGFMVSSGLCIAPTIFMSSDYFHLQLTFLLLGKMFNTASLQVLYFFTTEIFATNIRNSILSFCSTFGRFGSVLAPIAPVLEKHHSSAPAILFSFCIFVSAFFALFFPETNNVVLSRKRQESEQIVRNKKYNMVIEHGSPSLLEHKT